MRRARRRWTMPYRIRLGLAVQTLRSFSAAGLANSAGSLGLKGTVEGSSMRRNLVLWFVLLLTGFLAGFILQYAKLQRVLQELSASAKQLELCRSSKQLSHLRDT